MPPFSGPSTLSTDTLAQAMTALQDLPVAEAERFYAEQTGRQKESRDLEAHLVEYCNECVKESYQATKERREKDVMLWKAHETEQDEMLDKEDWQSQMVSNTPFTTVTQAASIVRQGVFERGQEFFTIEAIDPADRMQMAKASFWEKGLRFWENRPNAKIRTKFVDASRMAFATGQSMSMKFIFQDNHKQIPDLFCELISPWKTYPDPKKRKPRQPQTGLYNIHEEWVDLYELQLGQAQGIYHNVELVKGLRSHRDEARMFRQDVEAEREHEANKAATSVQTNKFRKEVLLREFWGDALDEHGEILVDELGMPLGAMTWSQVEDVLISGPYLVKYPTLRWPWIDFSPIPHPMFFHGYGIYEGSLLMWKFLNAVLNLYVDNETFRVANMWEVLEEALRDPTDTEIFPGKRWVVKPGFQSPVINPVLKGQSNLADIQFMIGLASKMWEDGTFVNPFVKGGEGTRKVTATELQSKTVQSLGVFDTISQDTEDAMIAVLQCAREVLTTYWNPQQTPAYHEAFKALPIYQVLATTPMYPEDRMTIMDTTAQVKVSGISKAFEKQKMVENLYRLVDLSGLPLYTPYVKTFEVAKGIGDALNQRDAIISEEEKMTMDRQTQIQSMIGNALGSSGIGPSQEDQAAAQQQPESGGPSAQNRQ